MPTRRFWALLVVSAIVLVGARVTVAAPEACPAPTAAAARAAAAAAADWIVANQFPGGTYTYAVDGSGADLGGYSVVRHAGVTLALYQVARATGDDRYQDAADRALDVDARPAPRRGRLDRADGRQQRAVGRQRPDARGARGTAPADRRRDVRRRDAQPRELPRGDAAGQRRLLRRLRPVDPRARPRHDLAVLRGRSALGARAARERAPGRAVPRRGDAVPRTSSPTIATTATSSRSVR